MRLTTGLLAALCAVVLFPSFLAQAQTPSATAASASSSSSSSKPEITADDKRLISQGYKMKYDNGEKLFCKMMTQPGSRFEKSVCQTAAQIQARTDSSKDAFDASRRTYNGPAVK
jgi:hypothetical protein